MTHFVERRKYQRCDSLVCKTFMSTDEKRWNDIELCDISAGGLRFKSGCTYEVKVRVYFNLYVYNMLSEFNMRMEGEVIRGEKSGQTNTYEVKFTNVNKYNQIQLDELIKSKICIAHSHNHSLQEEMYTMLLVPGFKRTRNKAGMYR